MRRKAMSAAVRLAWVVVLTACTVLPASAEVVRVEVSSRGAVAGGEAFGAAGPYEKLAGRIFFAIDPALPANRIITDVDKAPRNGAGKVEFSSDFYILKPRDIRKGNGS